VLDGEDVRTDPPKTLLLRKFLVEIRKYAPMTPCDAERSFSDYRHILSDRRKSRTLENMEKF
jgi:hypothetical protein